MSESLRQLIQNHYKLGDTKIKENEDMKDNIEEPHLYIIFQIDDDNMSQIHICKNMEEVKKYKREHLKTKYYYGLPACEGGDFVGKGEFAYFPLFPDN